MSSTDTAEEVPAAIEVGQCCNQDCDQGRKCPRRFDRRTGPSAFWRLLGWLLRERRAGFDRRARAEGPPGATTYPWMGEQCTRCGGNHSLSQRRWPVVEKERS